jgi:hypothetical protein
MHIFSFVIYFLKECLFESIFNNVLEEGVFGPLAQGLRLFCGLITLWKKTYPARGYYWEMPLSKFLKVE